MKTVLRTVGAAIGGLLSLVAALSAMPGTEAAAETEVEEFTVVLIPDTQKYSESYPTLFLEQMKWIRDHKKADHIEFAIHLGDIVENSVEEEWKAADEAMRLLDGSVPYSVMPGNHDLDRTPEDMFSREGTLFHKYFPPSRYEDRSWYGGHKDDRNYNNYSYFSAAGKNFMVLCLEFGPVDETLKWASGVLERNRDRHVIVATHSYMYHDDSRLGEGDDYSPHKKHDHWNDGEQVWEKLIRHHPNIFLVVSGHVKGDLTGYRVDEGVHGNAIHQLLVNYQTYENGGNGWLRTLRFIPAEDKIRVTAYSPILDEFNYSSDHSFTIDVDIWQ